MNPRTYLVHHRKRWALSQRELARLLGHRSRSTISRLEANGGTPSLRLAIGCQILFGTGVAELFPSFYADQHDRLMRRAAELDRNLLSKTGHAAKRKRQLLTDLIKRADNPLEV